MADYIADTGPSGRTPRAPTRRMGAWKLAYADFLTALCALFLVMWLVSDASQAQRGDIARQFGAQQTAVGVSSHAPSGLDEAELILRSSALFDAEAGNVSLTRADNKLRIELIDLDRAPLFENGEERLNLRGERLIGLTANVVTRLGVPVSIEGHTDSAPIARSGYSNWELSAGRANAARRGLVSAGVPPALIAGVTGLADTQPLLQDAAHLPQNRRLSIVVHINERP